MLYGGHESECSPTEWAALRAEVERLRAKRGGACHREQRDCREATDALGPGGDAATFPRFVLLTARGETDALSSAAEQLRVTEEAGPGAAGHAPSLSLTATPVLGRPSRLFVRGSIDPAHVI